MALIELDCKDRFAIKKVGSDTFVQGWANKAVVDRGKDIINMDAWNVNNFKKNPMMLFNHNKDMPIGKVVDVRPTDQGLWVKAKISNSQNPTISMVRDLINEGMLSTFSVGFDAQDEQKDEQGINNIKQAELYEVSVVTLPMNQDSTFDVTTKTVSKLKNDIRKKILKSKGAWVAEAVHGKIYDMEKSGTKRDDLISQIASGAGISADDLTQILAGNVTPVPENVLASFAEVLGLDAKKLQKLDAADAKIEGQSMSEQPTKEVKDSEPDQVAIIGILVPKDQAQDADAAQSQVSDAGYEPVSVEDQGDSWYVLLEDPADFEDGTSQLDLGNQIVGIVGLRKPVGDQQPEAQEPQPQPEAGKDVPPPPNPEDPKKKPMPPHPAAGKKPPMQSPPTPPPAAPAPASEPPKPVDESAPAPAADANPGDQPAPNEEDPAKVKEEYAQFQQDQEATVSGQPGNPASWVADEALWEKAKNASQAATGKIDYAFVVWWYLQHGGSKKSESSSREKTMGDNTAPISGGGSPDNSIDDNPYLEQARQTNVLLGVVIKTMQEMCAVMKGGAVEDPSMAKGNPGDNQPMTYSEDDEMEKQIVNNLRNYTLKLEEKLKKLGA